MNAIIFIPGYKASILKNRDTNRIVYITLKHLFKNESLACDLTGTPDKLVPAGILDEVSLLFLKVDICRHFLDKLNRLGDEYQLFCFDYDWRQDIIIHTHALDALIESIRDKYENIYFVCHSLGGYLLSYYLKYGTQQPGDAVEAWYAPPNVKKIVLMGVPFRGSLVALKDLHFNDGFLWNKQIFHRNIVRTFPAVYTLLPQYPASLVDQAGHPINIFDVHSWQKHRLSFWGEKNVGSVFLDIYEKYLSVQLKKSSAINQLITNSKKKPPQHCRILTIIGTGKPTPQQYTWDYERRRLLVKERVYWGDGDDPVLCESARLPDAYQNAQNREIRITSGHRGYFSNANLFDQINDFLRE